MEQVTKNPYNSGTPYDRLWAYIEGSLENTPKSDFDWFCFQHNLDIETMLAIVDEITDYIDHIDDENNYENEEVYKEVHFHSKNIKNILLKVLD